MRQLLSALAIVVGAATASGAQDLDWTGAYGGVSMATHSGTNEYDNDGDPYDLEGPAFGAYGGYLWGNGNLVYGAEAAVTLGGVYETYPAEGDTYKDEYEYDRFVDLKGRVGYGVSNFLVYGTLGLSRGRFQSDIGASDQVTTSSTGMIVGLGADYRIGDRFTVGGEYLRRNYDFYDAGQDVDIEADIDTFTLRLGMQF